VPEVLRYDSAPRKARPSRGRQGSCKPPKAKPTPGRGNMKQVDGRGPKCRDPKNKSVTGPPGRGTRAAPIS